MDSKGILLKEVRHQDFYNGGVRLSNFLVNNEIITIYDVLQKADRVCSYKHPKLLNHHKHGDGRKAKGVGVKTYYEFCAVYAHCLLVLWSIKNGKDLREYQNFF